MVFRDERTEESPANNLQRQRHQDDPREHAVSDCTPLVSNLQTSYEISKKYTDRCDDPVMIILTNEWSNVGIDINLRTDNELKLTSRAIIR